MKYRYTGGPGGDQWYQGLPAEDVDDVDLTAEGREILLHGIVQGVYVAVDDRPSRKVKPDVSTAEPDSSEPSRKVSPDDRSETESN